jgi:hypothetical protein
VIRNNRSLKGGGGLWLASLFVVLAGCVDASAAPVGIDSAAATVERFLALVKTDQTSAAAMLAPDAEMGAGDVGGPMDITVFSEFPHECSFDTSQSKVAPMDMPGRTITVVDAALHCGSPDLASSIKVQFFVEDGKIAGLYIPGGREMAE